MVKELSVDMFRPIVECPWGSAPMSSTFFVSTRKCSGEVNRCRAFTNPAFLIGYNNGAHHFLRCVSLYKAILMSGTKT